MKVSYCNAIIFFRLHQTCVNVVVGLNSDLKNDLNQMSLSAGLCRLPVCLKPVTAVMKTYIYPIYL